MAVRETETPSGLGDLSKLPTEIRLQIWQNVLTDRKLLPYLGPSKEPASPCLISHQIREEIYDILWRSRTLRFDVDPRHKDEWRLPTKVYQAEDQQRLAFRLYDDDQKIETELDIAYMGSQPRNTRRTAFQQIPFHLLRNIEIDVIAPHMSTPAHMIYTWAIIFWIVKTCGEFLLPSVHVRLIDLEPVYCTWSNEDGSLHHSFNIPPQYQSPSLDPQCSDLEIALLQFCSLRLRRGCKLSISLPTAIEQPTSIQRLVKSMEDEATTDTRDDLNDPHVLFALSQQNAWSIWLDLQLDTLANTIEEADFLRFIRFDTVGHEYFKNIDDRIQREYEREWVSKELLDVSTSALERRHVALLAFKPFAEGNTKLFEQYQDLDVIEDIEFRWRTLEEEHVGVPTFTSTDFVGTCMDAEPIFRHQEDRWRLRKQVAALRISKRRYSSISTDPLVYWY